MGQELPDIPTLKPGMDMKLPNEPQPDGGEAARKLYADTQPAVVQIVTSTGRGSGYFADSEGRVVTDAHVVLGDREVYAVTANGQRYKARIEKMDDINDLAVLKLVNLQPGSQPYLELDHGKLKPDQNIYALGHPRGARPMYISPGIFKLDTTPQKEIDAENDEKQKETLERKMARLTPKELEDAKADLARPLVFGKVHIEGGSSGGPLVNEAGKVIGVADMVDTKDHSKAYFNPANKIQSMLDSPSKFNFDYAYEPSQFARSMELKWQQDPGQAAFETGLGGLAGYVGYRAAARFPKMIGLGAGLYSLGNLLNDGNALVSSTDTRDQWKYGALTASDASMLVGSAAMLIPRARTLGLVALGLGVGGRIASNWIPNHLVLTDMSRADGDPRPPYTPAAVLTDELKYKPGGKSSLQLDNHRPYYSSSLVQPIIQQSDSQLHF